MMEKEAISRPKVGGAGAAMTGTFLLLVLVLCTGCRQPRESAVRYIEPDPETGTSAAVVVEPTPLTVSSNLLPFDASGNLIGGHDPDAQIAAVLENVSSALAEVGSDLSDVVKVNVYARSDSVVERVRQNFRETFSGATKPAVTFAVGKLRSPDADVAMDIVAIVGGNVDHRQMYRAHEVYGPENRSHLAVLPPGGHVYVSGQVARNEDLIAAARETFEASLARLSYIGLSAESIEQVKVFLHDIETVDTLETVLAEYFQQKPAPPIVSLEWVHQGFDIEIEMIASRTEAGAQDAGAITFTTPPGLRAIPVYSRIAEIHDGDIVYVSGLSADSSLNGEEQIRAIFGQFERILPQTGTDFEHLAKGQYYVADWDVVRALGTVRGEYYPPERPPTSSLIPVRSVGAAGSMISIDLIGVVPPGDTTQ